jgi:DNA polymerase elongation subunit (family B)
MIISRCDDGKSIFVSHRVGETKHIETVECRPYFFVKESHKEIPTYSASKYIEREFEYESGEFYNLDNEPLKKVYVETAFDISKARRLFKKTYEADVPLHFRHAVDSIENMPEYNMRKWYWDMEWQQGGEYHDCITTIVVYDNYDKQYYQWVWFPNQDPYNGFKMSTKEVAHMSVFNSEKDMIENFMTTMVVKDPDMLIAWFGQRFDIPHLIKRACAVGLNPKIMSPIASVKGVKKTKEGYSFAYGEKGFSPIEQPIGGRITLSLDLAFERQWNDSQRGTLPSLSLEYVSQLLFEEGKVKESKFTDKNEFFRRAWLEDTEVYLEYALVDVELIKRIDEKNFCSEAIISLQRLLKAPFGACFYASHMASIYFMRNAWWKAPTGNRDIERKEYEGAMIYDPLSEGTNGMHTFVAAFDFAQLYPSMMVARNISWETITSEVTELGVNIAIPRDFSEVKSVDMRYFKTDELGLLPKAVLELKELRDHYKALMHKARKDGSNEYQKWYNNQMAVKRLMASFYGIVAFQGFGWANVDLAASITASAREAIRLAAFAAKGMEG